jgi:hypothetical protein
MISELMALKIHPSLPLLKGGIFFDQSSAVFSLFKGGLVWRCKLAETYVNCLVGCAMRTMVRWTHPTITRLAAVIR